MHLDFEVDILESCIPQSNLLILAKGLGINQQILNQIQLYTSVRSLVFCLNYSEHDLLFFRNFLKDSKVNYDINERSERRNQSYVKGGVFFISETLMISDLIAHIIDPCKISSIFVLNAHNLKPSCTIEFILDFVSSLDSRTIVRGFTDDPVVLDLEQCLNILNITKVNFFPRFSETVKKSFTKDSVLLEKRLVFPKKLHEMEILTMEIIKSVMRELYYEDKYNSELKEYLDDFYSKNLSQALRILKRVIELIGHKPRVRRLVGDIKNLHFAINILHCLDFSCYFAYLQKLWQEQLNLKERSTWINSDSGILLIEKCIDYQECYNNNEKTSNPDSGILVKEKDIDRQGPLHEVETPANEKSSRLSPVDDLNIYTRDLMMHETFFKSGSPLDENLACTVSCDNFLCSSHNHTTRVKVQKSSDFPVKTLLNSSMDLPIDKNEWDGVTQNLSTSTSSDTKFIQNEVFNKKAENPINPLNLMKNKGILTAREKKSKKNITISDEKMQNPGNKCIDSSYLIIKQDNDVIPTSNNTSLILAKEKNISIDIEQAKCDYDKVIMHCDREESDKKIVCDPSKTSRQSSNSRKTPGTVFHSKDSKKAVIMENPPSKRVVDSNQHPISLTNKKDVPSKIVSSQHVDIYDNIENRKEQIKSELILIKRAKRTCTMIEEKLTDDQEYKPEPIEFQFSQGDSNKMCSLMKLLKCIPGSKVVLVRSSAIKQMICFWLKSMNIENESSISYIGHIMDYTKKNIATSVVVLTHIEYSSSGMYHDNTILLDPDLRTLRYVEVMQNRHIKKTQLKVFLLLYKESVEEQRYLQDIRNEKDAFTKLIKKFASLPIITKETFIDLDESQEIFTIIFDHRELRSKLPFYLFKCRNNLVIDTLSIGDYILGSKTCIERKNITDFIISINSGRLYTQLQFMIQEYEKSYLLLEFPKRPSLLDYSELRNHYSLIKKLVMCILHFKSIKILWSNRNLMTCKMFRELQKKDTCERFNTEKRGLIIKEMLLSIPGINIYNYKRIFENFKSLRELRTVHSDKIVKLLGKENGEMVYRFLNKKFSAQLNSKI